MLTNKTQRSIITKVSLLKKSKLNQYGEVSEWFKELVLKTSDSVRGRGFESHPLRQKRNGDYRLVIRQKQLRLAWRSTQEAEEDGLLNR